MGEALGNPKELEFSGIVPRFKVEARPFTEVGRIAAKIDGDVPDMAGEHANQFPLGLAELIMKASQDASGGERLVILYKMGGQTGRGEGGGIKNLAEPSATICEAPGLKDFKIVQRGSENLHPTSLADPRA